MVTKCSFGHNFTGASNQKTSLTKVVQKYALIKEMSWRPLTYGINWSQMFILSQLYWCLLSKTSLKKVVKEYALINEMSWRPVNMESFGHKMFILSQPYWCL